MRSLAVARNQSLRVSFTSNAALACYVIHTGGANDCQCNRQGDRHLPETVPQALRTVPFRADAPVAVRSNSASILADAVRGTITPTATMQVEGRDGEIAAGDRQHHGPRARVRRHRRAAGIPALLACSAGHRARLRSPGPGMHRWAVAKAR